MTRLAAAAFFGLFLAIAGALAWGAAQFIWTLLPPWAFAALFLGGFAASFAFDLITSLVRSQAEKQRRDQ